MELNKILRDNLKEAQVRLRKLGYDIILFNDILYLKRISTNDTIPESYIRVNLIYNKKQTIMDKCIYTLSFTTEPCKVLGGYSTMSLDFANRTCTYWRRAIKECTYLENLKITGTNEDFKKCLEDIQKKSRI